MNDETKKNLERFLQYVQIDTQSDDASTSTPSASKELNLTKKLAGELEELGIPHEIDEFGRLYGWMKGEEGWDPIGLNAHVDTALECSGANVKPRIIEKYDGGTIVLNETYSMSPKEFPTLGEHIGDDLVVTDGTTLLGADDKAGVAVIMAVLHFFHDHPEIAHHPISILFTPDEEIGRGPEHFNAEKFGAKYAYTIDGGYYREIATATFNAAHADVTLHGVSIHPGEAKGKMVNASSLAFEFDRLLPEKKRPQFTEGFEGFNHLVAMDGSVDTAHLHYIIRNHDRKKLEEQKEEFRLAKANLEKRYPSASIELEIGDDYKNMQEVLDEHPEAVEQAKKAFASLSIEPIFPPIRGGTDGATFSFLGCPTPNLGTGSYNHHGRFEYLSVQEWETMIEIAKKILMIR